VIDAFYSDPHFGHANILEYAARPFASIEEHDEELIRRYNACVGEGDVVLWCGDASFHRPEVTADILSSLHGRKLLVVGNHDRSPSRMSELGFDLVMAEATLSIAGRIVRVSHYPYERDHSPAARFASKRPQRVKGEVLIHGHVHDKARRKGSEIHVGVDAWDYAPAPYAAVEALVREVFGG
jgi:calcineurin-like phosphoesterase family protein